MVGLLTKFLPTGDILSGIWHRKQRHYTHTDPIMSHLTGSDIVKDSAQGFVFGPWQDEYANCTPQKDAPAGSLFCFASPLGRDFKQTWVLCKLIPFTSRLLPLQKND